MDHLLDAELCGVESHGIMRVLQYAEEVKNGYLQAHAVSEVTTPKPTIIEVDGLGGIGILAMDVADRKSVV